MFFYSRLLDLYFLQLYSLLYKAPPEEQEGQSEEEQLKQKTKERARKEFLGAVASEGKNNCQMWLGISIHCARIFANSSRKLECSRRSRAVKYFYDVSKHFQHFCAWMLRNWWFKGTVRLSMASMPVCVVLHVLLYLSVFRCYILHLFFSIFLLADGGLKARLEMIKNHAITVLQELKVRFISKLFLQTLERSTVKCLKRKTLTNHSANLSSHLPIRAWRKSQSAGNAYEQNTFGNGFTSHWWKKWLSANHIVQHYKTQGMFHLAS